MRKICLVIAIAAAVAAGVFAQSKESSGGGFNILSYPPSVEGGNILLDAGLGLTGWHGYDLKLPPLFLQVEYALPVGVPISVGGMFSIHSFGYDSGIGAYKYEFRWTELVIAARGNWHWGFNVNWLDVYTGLSLGYDISIASHKYNGQSYTGGTSYGGFYWGLQAGAHFYFTKTIGMVVESGYPYFLKVGVAVKF